MHSICLLDEVTFQSWVFQTCFKHLRHKWRRVWLESWHCGKRAQRLYWRTSDNRRGQCFSFVCRDIKIIRQYKKAQSRQHATEQAEYVLTHASRPNWRRSAIMEKGFADVMFIGSFFVRVPNVIEKTFVCPKAWTWPEKVILWHGWRPLKENELEPNRQHMYLHSRQKGQRRTSGPAIISEEWTY